MTVKFKKWAQRKNHYEDLIDITSQPYPALTNKEVEKEIDSLLKNSWISRRVEAKLLDLKQEMDKDRRFYHKK